MKIEQVFVLRAQNEADDLGRLLIQFGEIVDFKVDFSGWRESSLDWGKYTLRYSGDVVVSYAFRLTSGKYECVLDMTKMPAPYFSIFQKLVHERFSKFECLLAQL